MKISKALSGAFLSILILFFVSCSGGDTNLTITEEELTTEVEKTLTQYAAQGNPVTDEQKAELRQAVLDQLVERKLLLAAADEEGIKLDGETIEAELEKIRGQFPDEGSFSEALSQRGYTVDSFKAEMSEIMRIQKFLEEVVAAAVTLSDEELKAFYDENTNYFETGGSVSASHILIEADQAASETERAAARAKIEEVARRVSAGGDFAELAREYSEGPSGPNGGDLGSFQRGKMVPAFEEAAFALEPGEVSDIVETQFGFHIIKVTDKSESGIMGFEESKEAIRGFLKQQKEQEAVVAYIDGLKEKYTVETPE